MPTSTFDTWSFTNIGPLTTTFTAPASASCFPSVPAEGDNIWLALQQSPAQPYAAEHCSVAPNSECRPSGAELISLYSSSSSASLKGPLIAYHSPAHICPGGWTEAGRVAKASDGSSTLDASGAFRVTDFPGVPTTASELREPPPYNPALNVFASAMDAGETAVVCCPEEWTAHYFGWCYSNFPAKYYTATTMCYGAQQGGGDFVNQTYTFGDEVVTNAVFTFTGTDDTLSWFTTDLPLGPATDSAWASASEILTGFTMTDMVTLVSKPDDDLGDASEGSDPEESNAAMGGRAELGGLGGVAAVAAVWAAATVVGAAMLMPW